MNFCFLRCFGWLVSISLSVSVASSSVAADLFEDGLESGALKSTLNDILWGSSSYVTLSTERPKDGKFSLKFTFAGTDDTTDSWAEQRFTLGKRYSEIWVSYDIRIPDNYYHRTASVGTSNNKGFLMLWGGDYSKPTSPKMGVEFWPNEDGSGNSTASVRLSGVGYDKHYWKACPNIVTLSDRGKWIKIVVHAKVPTVSNNDGIYQLWKVYDDGKVVQACNLVDSEGYVATNAGFDSGYILGWSNSGYKDETVFYVDNFKVTTTPFGMLPKAPSSAVIK